MKKITGDKFTDSFVHNVIDTVYHLRRDRVIHPVGKFDDAGRWYPCDDEDADNYTSGIRSPSRAYPLNYNLTARSKGHIKQLMLYNPRFVIGIALAQNAELKELTSKHKYLVDSYCDWATHEVMRIEEAENALVVEMRRKATEALAKAQAEAEAKAKAEAAEAEARAREDAFEEEIAGINLETV